MIIFITIVSIATLILVHELGHFLVAKFFGMQVDEFGIGFPPRIFSKQFSGTLYSINLLPLGGFVRIHGETLSEAAFDEKSFMVAKPWKRSLVIVAGVFMNFLLGWAIMSAIFFVGTPSAILIEAVLPNSPASEVGLRQGDFVKDFSGAENFVEFIKNNAGKEIKLNINREGKDIEVLIIPRINTKQGEGTLGVQIADAGIASHGFFESIFEGFKASLNIMTSIFVGLYQIISTFFVSGKLAEGFVGPVGVFGIAMQSANMGLIFLLQLIGMISLNLAALNVLPFPALDGGRLLFIIIEKIKGSRLTSRFEAYANGIGFSLLIVLILGVTFRDVARLF